jgi:hypothetical protein
MDKRAAPVIAANASGVRLPHFTRIAMVLRKT